MNLLVKLNFRVLSKHTFIFQEWRNVQLCTKGKHLSNKISHDVLVITQYNI